MINLLSQVVFPYLITSVGWGIGPYFDKKALKLIGNKYEFLFICKLILAGLIALTIFLAAQKRLTIDISKKNNQKALIYLALATLAGGIIGHYYYLKALSNSEYTMWLILITYVVPLIIITLLSTFLLKEKMNCGMIVGLLTCVVGVSIFIYHSK